MIKHPALLILNALYILAACTQDGGSNGVEVAEVERSERERAFARS